jgi:hypothetical protein
MRRFAIFVGSSALGLQVIVGPVSALTPQRHVANPSGFFENVCHLRVTRNRAAQFYRESKPFNSSALLYRGRYLVTAAHNVHSNLFSRLNTLVVVCGAADSDAGRPGAELHRDAVKVLPGYSFLARTPGRFARDLAVVRLATPICVSEPARLGLFEFRDGSPMRIAGFPGEEGDGGRMDGTRLYSGEGRLRPSDRAYLLRHDVETEKGNSGGPVWVMRDGQAVVVGIHVAEGGSGRLFDPAVLNEVEGMINAFEAAQPTRPDEACPLGQ